VDAEEHEQPEDEHQHRAIVRERARPDARAA
jgi:hypothetical protein